MTANIKPGVGLQTIAFDGDGVLWDATWPSPVIGAPNEKAIALGVYTTVDELIERINWWPQISVSA